MLDCVEGRRRTRRQRETAETPPAVARTHILCLDGTPQSLALARKRRLCLKGRRRTKGTSRNKINYASSADVGDGTSLKRQTPNTAAAACWYREPERFAHTAKTHRLCAEGRPRTKAIAGAHRLCVKGRQRSAAKHRLCAGERLRTTALAGNHGLCFEGQRRTPALAGRHRHNTANNHATPLTIKYMTTRSAEDRKKPKHKLASVLCCFSTKQPIGGSACAKHFLSQPLLSFPLGGRRYSSGNLKLN